MIGIIYKFTILARYRMDGHKPFYVGQHVGVNDFNNYWGSGKIWNNFLDKLEEYYIKKEKAHYSYKLGGCNILWGATTNISHIDPLVRKKISDKWKDEDFRKMMIKIHIGLQSGDKHPLFGKKTSEETKEKIRAHYKGGMVVNNGVIIKYLKPNEDIPQGFVRGRKLKCRNL